MISQQVYKGEVSLINVMLIIKIKRIKALRVLHVTLNIFGIRI
jgi:hypothetical protein